MRRRHSFLGLSIAILLLWTGGRNTFAQTGPPGGGGGPPAKITFEGFLFPDNVIVESTRTLTFCLVNQGLENELIRSFIRNLRRKLGDDARQPKFILTEPQVGYRMPRP